MSAHSRVSPSANERGQSLVEYLVIVALMGVATIAIVRTMNEVVKYRFYAITEALQGKEVSGKAIHVAKDAYRKSDLGDFMKSAGDSESRKNPNRGTDD